MKQYYENRSRGMLPDEAAAWAANSEIESRGDHTIRQEGGGPGRGLFQWGANKPAFDRRIDFEKVIGVPVEKSTREQQFQFRDHELAHKEKAARLKIERAKGAGDKAYAISLYYLRPAARGQTAIARANLAEAILRQAAAAAKPKRPVATQQAGKPAGN